tara:strand:+ start:693 stop:953 length:261 start_codon:yes stop_codon:yes gene_type:complete
MTLLKFFLDFGEHGLGALWIPYIVLSIHFLYQTWRAHESGGTQQVPGGVVNDDDKTPIHKIPQFWFFVALTVAAVVIHLMIQSDYR